MHASANAVACVAVEAAATNRVTHTIITASCFNSLASHTGKRMVLAAAGLHHEQLVELAAPMLAGACAVLLQLMLPAATHTSAGQLCLAVKSSSVSDTPARSNGAVPATLRKLPLARPAVGGS
jgi:hypothetical protein